MITIHRVARLDLTFESFDWPFRQQNRDRIAQHFATVQSAKPDVWNGTCLQCRNPRIDGDVFHADYFRTDYASFLAWRDWNEFDGEVFHCFSGGALQSADGAFVMGRMSAHTANAGRVYFPSGTPDPSDIVGSRVDLAASVVREMGEETGLTPGDYVAADRWTVVDAGRVKACYRLLQSPLTADRLAAKIERNLAGQDKPELDRIVLVRGLDDLTDAMPDFVTAYLADLFEQRTR